MNFKLEKFLTISIILIGVASTKSSFIHSKTHVYKDDRVVDWHFGNVIRPGNHSISFDLKLFVPTQPGTYQVIIYLTGLDGFAEAAFYTEFCTKLVIASESIVIALDTIRYPSWPDKEEHLFAQTLDWTLDHIYELVQVSYRYN